MALIGYARVSTADQSLEAQEAQLRVAGCVEVYSDVMTGSAASRPQWDACRKGLRDGDSLVITRLDRAGRSLRHLLEISDELDKKGVTLTVLDQGIDTSTSQGRLSFGLLGVVAEFERALISERTKSAMAVRSRGRSGGRPKALSPKALERAQQLYEAGQMTVKEVARAVGVSEATLYRSITTESSRRKAGKQQDTANVQ
jgi:DNA invertase Pin-like site-specific DNA recombinase